ncbi:TAXI family TRAP transporter solute-binding subunit [Halomonas sp. NCCP-2165]|nr:TAXI family TRAP transporter solute-binding subunit [Halomonas sp. NCCP-2165]GKW50188.1 C4-dicarboxylate ABC transporter substrate-binding protein [Halomonas sp. NCCP-2165]
MRTLVSCLGLALGSLLFHAESRAQDTALVVGTASPAGVYHLAGRALCRLSTQPCRAEASAGSQANLEAIRRGELEFAFAQSDLHYYAVQGQAAFQAAGPDPELRSLVSLHSEPFTLVVRRDAGIRGLDDLPGRAVNIGNPGSGQRGTMQRLMAMQAWHNGDFRLINDLPAEQQSLELCHGNIDAMVYTVGHPNASVAQAIRLCDAALVDVQGEAVERLIADYPFFSPAWIAGGLYGSDQPAVRTFGVRATLVASASADPERVYRLVADLFDNLTRFKAFHPAFGTLTPRGMIHDGLSAPLHEGALRYYRERGWIEDEEDAAGAPTAEEFSAPGGDRGSSD